MVSSYLERPLRSLEQALDDRARRAPGAALARPAGSDSNGSASVELLVRLLSTNTDQSGVVEGPPPLDRRRAA